MMLKFKLQGSRVGRGKKAKGASEEVGGGEEESLQASRGAAGRARSVSTNTSRSVPTVTKQICQITSGSNSYMRHFYSSAGVDPKSVFCAFFKQGLCKKGDKCKFSHDPAVERKAAKRNLYEDDRENKDDDNMDDWDDDKLADVVNKKHGSEKSNQTDIVRMI